MELLFGIMVFAFLAYALMRKKTAEETTPAVFFQCAACGYDLRASPERCPECGMLVPPIRRPLDARKLRADWPTSPIEPRVPGGDEHLVRVWDAPNMMAANLFVEQLRARGIRATTQKSTGPMRIGDYTVPPADFSVSVYTGDVPAAEAIMVRLSRSVPSDA